MANYDGSAVQQTDEALNSLRLMFSVIPGALYVLTGGLLVFYHLNDRRLEEIRLALEQRRQA
jgi:Na+/melibiose symporter-like transporter